MTQMDQVLAEIKKRGSVTIEDDVFIGGNSIILKGVTVGSGAVIGSHRGYKP